MNNAVVLLDFVEWLQNLCPSYLLCVLFATDILVKILSIQYHHVNNVTTNEKQQEP